MTTQKNTRDSTSLFEQSSSEVTNGSLSDHSDRFDLQSVICKFNSDDTIGLTSLEAERRLKLCTVQGAPTRKLNAVDLLLDQFCSTVVILLLIAALASLALGERLQAVGILLAVIINAVVGFLTDYRSQMSLAELEQLSGPLARVRRDGMDKNVSVQELVVGDILLLGEGDRVPADAQLICSTNLQVDESALTGESIPALKSCDLVSSEKGNVLFQGSLVCAGKCRAIVTAVGSHTKLGKLGATLKDIENRATPLQCELEQIGKQLSAAIITICIMLLVIGLIRGENGWQLLQTSIALAIAAIPEGLPVVATLALAEGTRQMVKLGALTRRLSAVETLGCTDIVCTDKTGTLTMNELTVSDIIADQHHYSISGSGYFPDGAYFNAQGAPVEPKAIPCLEAVLLAATLCNDAKLESHDVDDWHIHGDPTEGALLTAITKAEMNQSELTKTHQRVNEFGFDMKRRRMTTVHNCNGALTAYCKGAPEELIDSCSSIQTSDGTISLDRETKKRLHDANQELARRGLRVLAFASKELDHDSSDRRESVENNMIFLGMAGMGDQPKNGVSKAIEACHAAGIQVVMMTGDQPATAFAIAQDIGLADSAVSMEESVIIGGSAKLAVESHNTLENISVIARAEPEEKFATVKALQAAGMVVAMTGDGVNDAAALKQADIGISMGQNGTSLAREASDMVLTDDNFSVIVRAIEQGRNIYANIRCSIAYLLTASIASVITISGASLLNLPQPLSPIQLLWLNLIMHIFPGLGLALQKSDPAIMTEKPRGRSQTLLDFGVWLQISSRGFLVAVTSLTVVWIMRDQSYQVLQTATLSTVSLGLLMQSWSWLSTKKSSKTTSLIKNGPMHASTFFGLLLLALSTYFLPIQQILDTRTPSQAEWLLIVTAASASVLISNLFKNFKPQAI